MDRPKHIIKTFAQLSVELRTRLRLQDPTLAIVRWRFQSSNETTLLEIVSLVDVVHKTQSGWLHSPCRVQRFSAGIATELTGLNVANMLWIDEESAVWVEDVT